MLNYFTISIIIILIIIIIVIFQNRKSNKSSFIESYGEYCGRYSYGTGYDIPTAKKNCKSDNECAWNETEGGWCGVNPKPRYEGADYSS